MERKSQQEVHERIGIDDLQPRQRRVIRLQLIVVISLSPRVQHLVVIGAVDRVLVKKEGRQYASLCVELDIASCGSTQKEAIQGLQNAMEAYLEYMVSEKRADEIYRPVPMEELKEFLVYSWLSGESPVGAERTPTSRARGISTQ